MVFRRRSLIDTSRANFISSFFPPFSIITYHQCFIFSNGYAEFYPRVFPNKFFKRFMNDTYDYRKSSNSRKLLATRKQISQINFKLATSNIYKVRLIPIVSESGVLKDLLNHDCIMDPSVRLLVTGKDSTRINSKPIIL